ncbi:MAG: DUF3786 domain-containing protein [Chloroflexota bacterium]
MYKGYEVAYRLACEELRNVHDVEELCLRSGATCRRQDDRITIAVPYVGRVHRVTLPAVEVSLEGSEEDVSLVDRILILHYLLQAKGTPLSNTLIGYVELPGGNSYLPTFAKRAIRPLVAHFGDRPERLPEVAVGLGGRPRDYGDASVTIDAFPRVPITFVVWRGDEEFPPEGNILFDGTVSDYLTTDDINALCGVIVGRLIRLSRAADSKV